MGRNSTQATWLHNSRRNQTIDELRRICQTATGELQISCWRRNFISRSASRRLRHAALGQKCEGPRFDDSPNPQQNRAPNHARHCADSSWSLRDMLATRQSRSTHVNLFCRKRRLFINPPHRHRNGHCSKPFQSVRNQVAQDWYWREGGKRAADRGWLSQFATHFRFTLPRKQHRAAGRKKIHRGTQQPGHDTALHARRRVGRRSRRCIIALCDE